MDYPPLAKELPMTWTGTEIAAPFPDDYPGVVILGGIRFKPEKVHYTKSLGVFFLMNKLPVPVGECVPKP